MFNSAAPSPGGINSDRGGSDNVSLGVPPGISSLAIRPIIRSSGSKRPTERGGKLFRLDAFNRREVNSTATDPPLVANYRSRGDTYRLDLRVKDLVAVLVGQHVSSRVALALSDQEHAATDRTEEDFRVNSRVSR